MLNTYTDENVAYLRANAATLTHSEMAAHLSKSEGSVRNKCWRLGLVDTSDNWTQEQIDTLKAAYSGIKCSKDIDLPALALKIGKHKSNVCRKARLFGLTDLKRVGVSPDQRKVKARKFATAAEVSANISAIQKALIAKNGHPRLMAGKSHTQLAKDKIAKASTELNASRTDEQKAVSLMKAMKTRVANGTYGMPRTGTTWKAAWREIGGIRKYFRSKWEANYAYYLEWLKSKGVILDWKHEPTTFWFEGVKRGCVSYLPDFLVTENNGSETYHEVKGWMDDRSKTKIRRMAKYHPKVKLIVIDSAAYEALRKSVKTLVPGWEL